eukprot:TRINITY_DN2790_c0_g4_i1.p1 TRINITY_DN2790_c0_g4~~TRINITY_DN2790_c0_g4_i1.p1  ORF type:complete len:269 (-),score=25.60 TRINITY_DN2790_c0_g4_i1:221-1027(-)
MTPPMLIEAAAFLGMEDITRWRTVDLATKKAFDLEGDDNVWRCCARNEYGDRLFVTNGLYAVTERQSCFKFFSMLSHANFAISSEPLIVYDLEGASLIERRLRNAVRACLAHRTASERDAQVLLGDFFLHDADVRTSFRFGGQELPATLAGLPSGVLEIGLFFNGNVLMSCSRYGVEQDGILEEYRHAASVQLTLNVDSAESETRMSYRGISLILDGVWRPSSDGCFSKCLESDSDWSILCVVSLLDGEPTRVRPYLTNALNLESYER